MTALEPAWTPSARLVVAALIAGVGVYGMALGTTYPLLGILLSDTAGDAMNGLNAAATGLGLLTGIALIPSLSIRLESGWVPPLGILVMAGSLAALSVAEGFWSVFAARFALGIGANFLFVIVETALTAMTPTRHRGRVMGLYTSVTAFGFVAGPALVAGYVHLAQTVLLGCAAIVGLAVVPLAAAARSVSASVSPAPWRAMLAPLRGDTGVLALVFLASAVDAIVIALLPVISLRQGFSTAEGAGLVAIFHLGLVLGQPLIGVCLDMVGRRRTLIACCAVSVAATAVAASAGLLGFWPVAAVMLVWGGANYGLYTGGLTVLGDTYRGAALAAAVSCFAAIYAVASSMAAPLSGLVLEGAGAAGFYAVCAGAYGLALVYVLCQSCRCGRR